MPKITTDERRARLAVRHHLAPASRAGSVLQVAKDLVCLHATDPATVYLSAWARMKKPTVEAISCALYDDRELLRMLAMRRTMWVVPVEDAHIIHSAATPLLARNERRRNEQIAKLLGVARPAAWLRKTELATITALEKRGEAMATELVKDVPALGKKLLVNEGKPYQAMMGISGRILLILAIEGKVVRGRPRGTWVSSQHRWATTTTWLGQPLSDMPEADAKTAVIRRYLSRFGPASEDDIRWWTGWTAGSVRHALKALEAVAVDMESETGYVLPDDLGRTRAPRPWVALLPSLDPTTMGWKNRGWYLGDYKRHVFDNNGNAGPTIWADGRIVGGWAIRSNGEVVTRLLEDIGKERTRMVEAEAARLMKWTSPAPVMPRFPTPLHKEWVK
jgi:hypothetical protein